MAPAQTPLVASGAPDGAKAAEGLAAIKTVLAG
jgi:hypothetical protein